ncbi:MAG: ribulose-phosphate 3-epimerase [Bacteroidia bacterium]|nr:ribulose-phosphate 3-epimerase [Bacteroidia bacterium]MDW8346251.1 ribulose-phosphate 3-epimerase [Bacteroidia bacterium]
MIIAPSILSADFGKLSDEVNMLNTSVCDWIHCDIMDGVFVPNLSFGIPVLQSIKRCATKPLDVHLMIVQPERYIQTFKDAGADILTVHIEASPHLHRTLSHIKNVGLKAGVAINPHTTTEQIYDILYLADLVCVMSVNPGFGGQEFITHTFKKVEKLKNKILQESFNTLVEVDGGVNQDNAALLKKAGADVLVAGSFVFTSPNPIQTIASLKQNLY